jgi:hypothetical protein
MRTLSETELCLVDLLTAEIDKLRVEQVGLAIWLNGSRATPGGKDPGDAYRVQAAIAAINLGIQRREAKIANILDSGMTE